MDESFSELAGRYEGLVGRHPDNVVVLRSLTKTWAMPGLRLGYAEGVPSLLAALRGQLQSWPLSSFGEAAALRALADREWPERSAAYVAEAGADLSAGLEAIEGLEVFTSPANFVLVKLTRGRMAAPIAASGLAEALLARGMAIRTFSAGEGLDDSWFRIAVRRPEENARFLAILRETLGLLIAKGAGERRPGP